MTCSRPEPAVERQPHLIAGALLLLVCLVSLSGLYACGNSGPDAGRPDPRRWLSVDAAGRRVTITLVAAYDRSASGLNLDGAVKGSLLFEVPVGWRVSVRCVNNANTTDYACALLPAPGSGGGRQPQIVNSARPVPPGGEARLSFQPHTKAAYRLVALLDGRPVSGMWAVLDVVPGNHPKALWLR